MAREWIERRSDAEHGFDGGAPVADDFDFEDFCEHYELDVVEGKNGKYIFKACPFKGDHHTSNGKPDPKATCLFYDGSKIGFKCLASSCSGSNQSIGGLIRFLNQSYEPYPGPIFREESTEELLRFFGAEKEADTCEQWGCRCAKRHPLQEEIKEILREEKELKAAEADAKTLKIVEHPLPVGSELVLASGETDGGVIMNLQGTLASSVITEEMCWLWDQRIPAGKTTLFTGKADNGKSMCLIDVISRTSTGREWPDGTPNTLGPRKVLLAASEDDPADTLVPRLIAAEANLHNVILVTVATIDKKERKTKRMLKLKEDAKLLEVALRKHPDIALVALDPLSSFFGGESLNKDEAVRPIMDALSNTLRKTGPR